MGTSNFYCPRCLGPVGEWDSGCERCGLEPGARDWCTDLMAGLFLDERYLVEKRLDGDGMALAFRASDMETGRPVVIRALNPDRALVPAACEAFVRDASAARNLEIPGVARILDVRDATSDWQVPYLVRECADGESLMTLLERDLALELPHALEIARMTAMTLDMIHAGGLVHRHLRPEKVIVPDVILDLGFACVDPSQVTMHGPQERVERYMSPEQSSGTTLPQADIYSLGMMMVEMFGGIEASALLDKGASPQDIGRLVPGLSDELASLVSRMLSPDPERRPGSARRIASSLHAILGILPASEPHRRIRSSVPPPCPERPSLPPGRKIGDPRMVPAVQPPPPVQGIPIEPHVMQAADPEGPGPSSALSTVPPAARPNRRRRLVASIAALAVILVVLAAIATIGTITFLLDSEEEQTTGQENPRVLAPPLLPHAIWIPEQLPQPEEPLEEVEDEEPAEASRPKRPVKEEKPDRDWELLD
jgi:serine/threonine protein kinase